MGNVVKIGCTSDTHGMLGAVVYDTFTISERMGKKAVPQVLVFAGDIAPAVFGVSDSKYIRDEFFGMIREHPKTEFVYTPGNHDFFAQHWDKYKNEAPQNLHFLMDSGCVIKGLSFYGSPWVPYINGGWAFECYSEEDLKNRFSKIPRNVDVLVTHSPPRIDGYDIDVTTQYRIKSRPFGSTALYEAICEKKPRYAISGHIHSGDHQRIDIQHADGTVTSCYNVSHVDERYEPTYPVTMFSIEKD